MKIRAAEEARSVGVLVEGLIREYLVTGKTPKGEQPFTVAVRKWPPS